MATNKHNKTHRKQFYHRILVAFLVVSILPVIISSFISYDQSQKTLRDTIFTNNLRILEKLKGEIDDGIGAVYNEIFYFTLYNRNISYFSTVNGAMDGNDYLKMQDLLTDISVTKTKDTLLSDIIVCLRNQPYILASRGSYDYRHFIDFPGNELLKEVINIDGRADSKSAVSSCKYYFIDHMAYGSVPSAKEYHILRLHFALPYNAQTRSISVTALATTDSFADLIKNSKITDEGIIAIVGGDGRVITDYSGNSGYTEEDVDALGLKVIQNPGANGTIAYAGRKFITVTVDSGNRELGWKYVVFIPESEINNKLSPLTRLSLIVISCTLLAGLLLAYMASKSVYHPLEGVFRLFDSKSSPAGNEIAYLSGNIKRILMDNEDMQHRLIELLPVFQEKALVDLLHKQMNPAQAEAVIRSSNLRVPLEFFRTAILIDKDSALTAPVIDDCLNKLKVNHYCLYENGVWTAILNYTSFHPQILMRAFDPLNITLCYMTSMLDRFLSAVRNSEKQPVSSLTEQIIEYVNQNITRDISLEDLSRHFDISYSYMSNIFKNYTDKGFKEYINYMRIQRARELLAQEDMSVQQVASMVGYTSALTFTRNFKKYLAVTPGAYQESMKYKPDFEKNQ